MKKSNLKIGRYFLYTFLLYAFSLSGILQFFGIIGITSVCVLVSLILGAFIFMDFVNNHQLSITSFSIMFFVFFTYVIVVGIIQHIKITKHINDVTKRTNNNTTWIFIYTFEQLIYQFYIFF